MNGIDPITANFKAIAPITGGVKPETATAADFAQMLKDTMVQANQSQLNSDKMAIGLVTGEVENIHRAVIAIAQADINFRYVLQIRNKIVDAYQEIMRMQI